MDSNLWQVKGKVSLETRKSSKTNEVLSKGYKEQAGRGSPGQIWDSLNLIKIMVIATMLNF